MVSNYHYDDDGNIQLHQTKANIDGNVVEYNLASTDKDAYPKVENKVYLGCGKICEIDGVAQTSNQFYHFWKR